MSFGSLSDYNISTRKSSLLAKAFIYSDVSTAFNLHPVHRDIRPITDIEAVKRSVQNLVRTSNGERPFHPEIGSSLNRILFEPADTFTAISLKQQIENVLFRFEPRIADVVVQVYNDSEKDAYLVVIGFRVINFVSDSPVEVKFYLNRLR